MSSPEPTVVAAPEDNSHPVANGGSNKTGNGTIPNGSNKTGSNGSIPNGSNKTEHNGTAVPNGSHHKKSSSPTAASISGALHKDLITRGVYKSNPLGTSTFVGLRALDPLLQFGLLGGSGLSWGESILSRLGIPAIPFIDHALTITPDIDISSTILFPSSPSLSPTSLGGLLGLPTPRLIIFLMATGSSLKQIFWLLYTSREEFTPSAAITVSVYNTLVNSLASLLLIAIPTSASLAPSRISIPLPVFGTFTLPLPMAIGSALYISGMSIETASEVHRKKFKDKPKNKGEVCTTGLWSKARHVNYAGYTLWRTGYALAAGGWIAGGLVAAWHVWGFAYRSIGLMDEYMSGRYKEKWEAYKKDVPWKLVPGIY
ncbi:hypothetical protein V8F06_008379 [Rhypophila decipiens]